MSLSKPIPLCRFCESEKGKYMCPRCNIRYCSAKCYKDPAHERCTEMFFQEWVMTTLREQSAEEAEKRKMLEILKGDMHSEEDEASDLDDEYICVNAEGIPIEERFQDLNVEDNVDEKQIWDRLSVKEKDRFKTMLEDKNKLGEIIPVKKPWWSVTELNLVSEIDADDRVKENIAKRPPFPIDVKSLSVITSKPPSPTLPFNIVNILYTYAFLIQFYNFDLRDLLEDVVDSMLYLSPVLSQNKNYSSLDESVEDSIRLLTGSHFQVSMVHAKSFLLDVCSLIDGPSNAQPYTFVLCALNDLKMLAVEFKMLTKAEESTIPKDMKQMLQQVHRKIDFYLSWTIDCYEAEIKPMSAKIQLQYVAEIMQDLRQRDASDDLTSKLKPDSNKMLIEELN